ncbi:MAG: dicarboxylate/amino acid:cation symporter [Leptospira sp.]|jgi:Na+/H+-dicarboxylate symporter|nr:dicarboxylate/amino acid:cation symporter [Leptospira sp.]
MTFRLPAFWIQILIGLFFGIVTGIMLNEEFGIVPKETLKPFLGWLRVPGDIFLNMLQMIMVPLIISSIAIGVSSLQSISELMRLGSRTLVYFTSTSFIAIVIGITIASWIEPGQYIQLDLVEINKTIDLKQEEVNVTTAITNLIPKNLIQVYFKQEMLSLVVFGIFLGVFFLASKERSKVLKDVFLSIEHFCIWTVSIAMKLAPLAVFGLMSYALVHVGFSLLAGLLSYVSTVLLGLSLVLILYLLLILSFTRSNPFSFLWKIREVAILGFSTSSSSSVLPYSLQVAKDKVGVQNKIADFVIPLGATINMDGTALYQAVATVFLAQVYQVPLDFFDLSLLAVTVTAASIGTAATPGVGIVILAGILQSFHIPLEGITILFGVDRILDMCRTSVNLTGDQTAAFIMNHYWKEN